MHSAWFRSTFLGALKFLRLKEGGPNFWGKPTFQKVWIFWSLLLYLNYKCFVDPNSLSFIRYQCILHVSGVLFSESWNFFKLRRGGDSILQKVWIIWSSLLYLNFESFPDPHSSSFIRFQCIQHDSGVHFSESWNFFKLNRGDIISRGNQFWRESELFGPPFCSWISKAL